MWQVYQHFNGNVWFLKYHKMFVNKKKVTTASLHIHSGKKCRSVSRSVGRSVGMCSCINWLIFWASVREANSLSSKGWSVCYRTVWRTVEVCITNWEHSKVSHWHRLSAGIQITVTILNLCYLWLCKFVRQLLTVETSTGMHTVQAVLAVCILCRQ